MYCIISFSIHSLKFLPHLMFVLNLPLLALVYLLQLPNPNKERNNCSNVVLLGFPSKIL